MNYAFLSNTALFRGATAEEIESMLNCLDASVSTYEKGQAVYRLGQAVEQIGLVLSGSVNIENDDLWGNRTILAHIDAGHIFADSYSCIPGEPLLVNVVASCRTEVLFLNTSKILQVCPCSCGHHHLLVKNLLRISAQKNLQLSRRILYTSSKTIRGRLMMYFSDLVKQAGCYTVTTPFNRQQLADYLSLDRSAMSNELSKMRRDGILTYEKNTFHLNEKLEDE